MATPSGAQFDLLKSKVFSVLDRGLFEADNREDALCEYCEEVVGGQRADRGDPQAGMSVGSRPNAFNSGR